MRITFKEVNDGTVAKCNFCFAVLKPLEGVRLIVDGRIRARFCSVGCFLGDKLLLKHLKKEAAPR